jgi:hypothetical protein
VEKVSNRQKLVEHFALFLEGQPLLRKVPELELRCGSDVRLEL